MRFAALRQGATRHETLAPNRRRRGELARDAPREQFPSGWSAETSVRSLGQQARFGLWCRATVHRPRRTQPKAQDDALGNAQETEDPKGRNRKAQGNALGHAMRVRRRQVTVEPRRINAVPSNVEPHVGRPAERHAGWRLDLGRHRPFWTAGRRRRPRSGRPNHRGEPFWPFDKAGKRSRSACTHSLSEISAPHSRGECRMR